MRRPLLLLPLAVAGLWACSERAEPEGAGEPGTAATASGLGPRADLQHVGSARCASCHPAETEAWSGSHHDLALQEVREETVLAPFDTEELEHDGVTWRFLRDGERFLVESDETGSPVQHEVALVFGVSPLQQYLVAFEGGRLQALPTAWDSRPEEDGGQRWYHLYPDEHIPVGDELHWHGINQTWNSMCAECHSTDLVRGWDTTTRAFSTRHEDADVGCEACHGPGSAHVEWAEAAARGEERDAPAARFLVEGLKDRDGGKWVTNGETGLPVRLPARDNRPEVETCAKCHSRRRPLTDGTSAGERFLDGYEPSLLREGLYHADGQILDEVYVWGSFAQSRMHAAGVSCRDCHDPHSMQLKAQGNAVCTQCHDASRFDVEAHHHHPRGGEGARCVDCHMAERHYMVVDGRRDHSFRVPRPDLSAFTGSPDACSGCHEEGSSWAAEQVASWLGDRRLRPHFGPALAAVRRGDPTALPVLAGIAADEEQPALVRATALFELGERLEPAHLQAVVAGAYDEEPLVRAASARAVEGLPAAQRGQLIAHLLTDELRAVRVAAARALAAAPAQSLDAAAREALKVALAEAREAELVNGERSGSWLNLGVLAVDRGDLAGAEQAIRTAQALDPRSVPAAVNLADVLRTMGRESEARSTLEAALAARPNDAVLHHSLGLAWVRAKDYGQAEAHFAEAASWAPEDPRNALMHGLCVAQLEDHARAVSILENGLANHPVDVDLTLALLESLRPLGRLAEGLERVRALRAARPDRTDLARVEEQLRAELSR